MAMTSSVADSSAQDNATTAMNQTAGTNATGMTNQTDSEEEAAGNISMFSRL
jgi:hypothetical protein